ncbi:hydroxymyristoyl-ACP dehydratase [Clostridium oceanicum]|uniref:Hydroxymyristoyl-ACP dehydratase n=1 Tax=Clostridium oceanicum TaxID=1543 RepID=A0ABP3UG05_9CLOT
MTINCSENCKNKKDGRCILNYVDSFLSIHPDNTNCPYFIPKDDTNSKKSSSLK